MKRLNYILLAGLSLVAAVSCNKQLAPAEEPEGIPMTLKATIGGTDTKLGFTKDGNALKGKWNANEEISVISCKGGQIVYVDKFTTGSESDGQTTADFKGTYHGDSECTITVVYPALEEYSSGNYGTPLPAGTNNDAYRFINSLTSNRTFNFYQYFSTQSKNGDTAHLNDFSILTGNGTVSGSDLTVTLKPITSVFRVTISFDSTYIDEVLKWLVCRFYESDGTTTSACFATGGSISPSFHASGDNASVEMEFGSYNSDLTQIPIALTSSDLTFVAYVPFVPDPGAKVGAGAAQKLKITLGLESGMKDKTIDLTADTTLESGKVYDIAVSFP